MVTAGMFKADPIREQMRAFWTIPVFLGAAIICLIATQLIEPYFSEFKPREEKLPISWMLVGSAIVLAGGYLIVRDHLVRPLRTLMREIPDPADMWRLVRRVSLSGLFWSPVMAMGLAVIVRDLGGLWTIAQIGLALLILSFTQSRGAQSVDRIVEEVLPQAK